MKENVARITGTLRITHLWSSWPHEKLAQVYGSVKVNGMVWHFIVCVRSANVKMKYTGRQLGRIANM